MSLFPNPGRCPRCHVPNRGPLGCLCVTYEGVIDFGLRIEGTTQALTSEGCTVCDDIPGLTDHGQGD